MLTVTFIARAGKDAPRFGPFGAVCVSDGEIRGHTANTVTSIAKLNQDGTWDTGAFAAQPRTRYPGYCVQLCEDPAPVTGAPPVVDKPDQPAVLDRLDKIEKLLAALSNSLTCTPGQAYKEGADMAYADGEKRIRELCDIIEKACREDPQTGLVRYGAYIDGYYVPPKELPNIAALEDENKRLRASRKSAISSVFVKLVTDAYFRQGRFGPLLRIEGGTVCRGWALDNNTVVAQFLGGYQLLLRPNYQIVAGDGVAPGAPAT